MLNYLMQTNINNYAIAVLLSVNISAYKGDIPRNHILVCIPLMYYMNLIIIFSSGYSQAISLRFTARDRTRLRKLGEDYIMGQLCAHSSSGESQKTCMYNYKDK